MEARFEALWKNRTPIDTELDDLTRHGRLGWEKFIPEDEAGNVNIPHSLMGPVTLNELAPLQLPYSRLRRKHLGSRIRSPFLKAGSCSQWNTCPPCPSVRLWATSTQTWPLWRRPGAPFPCCVTAPPSYCSLPTARPMKFKRGSPLPCITRYTTNSLGAWTESLATWIGRATSYAVLTYFRSICSKAYQWWIGFSPNFW